MALPLFLDIEMSHPDEGGFPVAIAWSLPDGSIKSVLIVPDDDWAPWDNVGLDIDLQHLIDQGEAGPDIIRELNLDLVGQTVFVDDLDDDEHLLALLFETYSDEPNFEMASIRQLYPRYDLETLLSLRHQVASEYQFDLDNIEDRIRALLYLNQQLANERP